MKLKYSAVCFLVFAMLSTTALAKKDRNHKKEDSVKTMTDSVTTSLKDTTAKKDNKSTFKSIKEITEKCKKFAGLFPIYQDTTTGKTYIEISEDKLGKEFIYFAYVLDGVIDAGFARGGYKDNSVFKIEKYFDRIDFLLQNTNFYFDKNTALSKAADANINQPLFYSEKIAASSIDNNTKKRSYLIESDNLFLGENITQVKPSKDPNSLPTSFTLGALSSKKSKYLGIKNFPENTDVAVEYIYENPAPVNYGGDEVTDARFVSVKMQHSLIAMPENNFKPRNDDPRVGYFMEKITDQTTASPTPWKDVIHRWNLEKKDPNATLSEPVKPITWWIENTTPKEFRPIIKNAVLAWNEAFEQAGFKNAVQCFEQPDTASWDAQDIRYNVLRWTSSPRPPYGGYGPSFVNPRTGEILGADIMLEYIFLTNRLPLEKLYDVTNQDNLQSQNNLNNDNCSMGEAMHQNILYGTQLLNAFGFSDIDKDKFIKQALYDLVLHEIGHTFGLMHNFIGSQWHTLDEVNDPVLGATVGLTASVMDYTIPNISEDTTKQGLFFDIKPGPYDKWAIQYGYTPTTVENNDTILQKILAESVKKENRFMNDADDMRSVGKGIDPRANIYDMTDDAIGYAIGNIKMVNTAFSKVLKKYSTPNQSYQELRNAFITLSGHYGRSLNIIDRYVGGVYVNRDFVGQDPNSKPFTPVSFNDQKRAMQAIVKYGFSKNAFKFPAELYNYLQMQRRGYDFRKESEDPKIHDRILTMQKAVLDQLLNNVVMQRLTDTKLYGNKYSVNNMLRDVTNGIFIEDLGSTVSTIRQNLQEEYVTRLLSIINPKSTYNYTSKSAAYGEVQRILGWTETNAGADIASKAHSAHLAYIIKQALETK